MSAVEAMLLRLASYYELQAQSAVLKQLFALVTRESLQSFDSAPGHSFSAINGNGFPVQFSVSLGAPTRSLRCLGEVAASGISMPERLRLSTLRLREILSLLDLRPATGALNDAFAILFPKDPAATLRWTGGIWMGFGGAHGGPIALRLYVNQRWGNIADRVTRAGQVLSMLGRQHSLSAWAALAPRVSAGAIPYGVAFDVARGGIGAFKMYFACPEFDRSYVNDLVDLFSNRLGREQTMRWLSLCGLYQGNLRAGALLPAIEFKNDTDQSIELKLDVSCNHLETSDVAMDQRIRIYLQELSIPADEYDTVLVALSSLPLSSERVDRIQYCGVGLKNEGVSRFNIYLCPGGG
jgi:hypothetical protein